MHLTERTALGEACCCWNAKWTVRPGLQQQRQTTTHARLCRPVSVNPPGVFHYDGSLPELSNNGPLIPGVDCDTAPVFYCALFEAGSLELGDGGVAVAPGVWNASTAHFAQGAAVRFRMVLPDVTAARLTGLTASFGPSSFPDAFPCGNATAVVVNATADRPNANMTVFAVNCSLRGGFGQGLYAGFRLSLSGASTTPASVSSSPVLNFPAARWKTGSLRYHNDTLALPALLPLVAKLTTRSTVRHVPRCRRSFQTAASLCTCMNTRAGGI